jgi:predicted enzyme related to lactoylglutathione lyase
MVAFQRAAAIFPVRDVAAAMEHYRSLGFTADAYDDPPTYAFAERDDVHLHLTKVNDLDPDESMVAVYLYVDDADAVAAEWASSAGRHVAVHDTPYGLREGAHVDPDGNLIRFGSRLPAANP